MATKQYQFTVGDRTFTMSTLQPFSATSHFMKIKGMLEKGMGGGLDSNIVSVLAQVDENTLKNIIFPILAETQLTCISAEQKLQSINDMNDLYSVDDMDEFFVVVWEVLKANFSPFFKKLAKNLFGVDLDEWDLQKIQAMAAAALEKVQANSQKNEK